MEKLRRFRSAWNNAYYRITITYIALIVTLMFAFQVQQYLAAESMPDCPMSRKAVSLIPVIGVFFNV
jgi:hypothetical protein